MSDLPTEQAGSLADDIELFEMANLSSRQTGLDGVIYISTAQAGHAPRVKWYPGRPRGGAPCLVVTLEDPPAAINKNLRPVVADAAAEQVCAWVDLNRSALLDFWVHGNTWLDEEVDAFKRGLRKLD